MSLSSRGAMALLLGLLVMGSVGCGSGMVGRRAALLRVGDTKAAVIPPLGIVYTKVRAQVTAGTPGAVGSRRGESSVIQLATPPLPGIAPPVPLVAWGHASMEAAAKDGGIESVSHMDYELTTVLMVWRRFKLIAYGE